MHRRLFCSDRLFSLLNVLLDTRTSLATQAQEAARVRPRALLFFGPAALISVGYMDPGNWATDLEGGARFGYQLLWVLVASNLVALLLQTLAVRLGTITGLDLAQACRAHYPRRTSFALWLLAEVAIVACDLAEIIGSALALNLLFDIPMLWGAAITVADVFLILALQRRGMRGLQAIVLVLILTIALCLAIEMFLIKPSLPQIAAGLVPRLDGASLYIAVGIVGATVMPHNLYLHSAIVKTNAVGPSPESKRWALRYYFFDTAIALNLAFIINASILIVAAGVFFSRGIAVSDIREAHGLLAPLLGTGLAATVFAIALLCSGQSSTITGTLAGQFVMEGFLRIRLSPLLRRSLTRLIAVVPALAVLAIAGDAGALPLLVASQVVLSLQLPFAIVPLIRLTNSRQLMGIFANNRAMAALAAFVAILIVAANAWLVARTFVVLQQDGGPMWSGAYITILFVVVALAFSGQLLWIATLKLKGLVRDSPARKPPLCTRLLNAIESPRRHAVRHGLRGTEAASCDKLR